MEIIRTQAYLRKDQHHELRDQAHQLGISFTELLRRVLDEYLHRSSGAVKAKPRGLASIVGLGQSGVKDGSTRYKEYNADAIAERLEKRDLH